MNNETPLLKITDLTKVFGGQKALDRVSLTVMPGEVHGLLGENGSGKSTLIKILSGFYEPEAGSLEVNGTNVPLPLLPGQYRSLGFEFVHQDLGLLPSLTVTENLFMGRVAGSRAKFLSWRSARREAARVFDAYDVKLDPAAPVDEIRPVQRAVLAIIRAVEGLKASRPSVGSSGEPNLLVLDEPTVFLPRQEVGVLFDLVRGIVADGNSVLFVSHDLDEVRQITKSVSVLRDGRSVGTLETATSTKRDLVKLIVGRDLAEADSDAPVAALSEDIILTVSDLNSSLVREVSFELRQGEILGLAGLVGSGYEDPVYSLFGADASATGSFQLGDRAVSFSGHRERDAVRMGMALVPADRKIFGSIPDLPMADNINVTVLDRFFSGGRLKHGKLRDNARSLLKEFDVRPPLPSMDYGFFSGGNQQKAMMAKWLQLPPTILLLHEPTQGVDIGAREQIYQVIRANAGTMSTIVASSDYEELATLCDRVGIFVKGQLLGFLTGDEVTHARIAEMCMGQVAEVREAVSSLSDSPTDDLPRNGAAT
ncbi:MAG: sugar ABC transporter ATP-binding protein [Actinomycetota bacterium]|nr:sugar ABC transporter ATP-binding protein [Actinomycetota bacterium]